MNKAMPEKREVRDRKARFAIDAVAIVEGGNTPGVLGAPIPVHKGVLGP